MITPAILVVDDEPQIRRVMRMALTARGYAVTDAKSGEEALDQVREHRFDLIVLDMNMPGMGGLETCRWIRSGSEVGIIMLTIRSAEADKVAALDAGADDYVTKPFSMPELLARIRANLRRVPAASWLISRGCSPLMTLKSISQRATSNYEARNFDSPRRSSICCTISWPIPTPRSPIENCCKRCGGRTTETRSSTCTSS